MAAKRVTSGGIAKRGDVVCRTHVNTITHADHKRVRITYSRASTFREDQGLIAFDCFLILFHFFLVHSLEKSRPVPYFLVPRYTWRGVQQLHFNASYQEKFFLSQSTWCSADFSDRGFFPWSQPFRLGIKHWWTGSSGWHLYERVMRFWKKTGRKLNETSSGLIVVIRLLIAGTWCSLFV